MWKLRPNKPLGVRSGSLVGLEKDIVRLQKFRKQQQG